METSDQDSYALKTERDPFLKNYREKEKRVNTRGPSTRQLTRILHQGLPGFVAFHTRALG